MTTYARANDRLNRSSEHRARQFSGNDQQQKLPEIVILLTTFIPRVRNIADAVDPSKRSELTGSTQCLTGSPVPKQYYCYRSFDPIEPDRAKVFPFTSLTVAYDSGNPLNRSQRESRMGKHINSGYNWPICSLSFSLSLSLSLLLSLRPAKETFPVKEHPHTYPTSPNKWTTTLR